MTSRERVRAVLEHRLPDRVPCGLGGCETAGLHVLSYQKLQTALGIAPQPPRVDTFMINAVFEEEALAALEGDILLIASPLMCKSPLLREEADRARWKDQPLWGTTLRVPESDRFSRREDGALVWETANHMVCPPGSYFFDEDTGTDLLAAFDYPDPEDYHPRDDFDDDFLRRLENEARRLYEETDYCLSLGETITDLQYAPGGQIGVMVLMMEDPDTLGAYLEKAAEAGLKQLTLLEQAVGKYVDILCIAHDFGDNNGVTIGDGLWRDVYGPHYKRLFQGWHRRTRMKINMHSCGAVAPILPDLVDYGLDLYNPVQVSARGMAPHTLKERFGKKLIFWGGDYDAQQLRPSDDYDTAYAQVKENLTALKKGGGHIFSGVHNLPPDVPQHHLQALLDAWRDHRDY